MEQHNDYRREIMKIKDLMESFSQTSSPRSQSPQFSETECSPLMHVPPRSATSMDTSITRPISNLESNYPPLVVDGKTMITGTLVRSIHCKSNSDQNFAANIVRHLVPPEIRKRSNCVGFGGKQSLDKDYPNVLPAIYELTKNLYNIPQHLGDECVKKYRVAIDSMCRKTK